MRRFSITREIGIDAGHRVTNHHSKCANLHGHRYTVQATVEGELADEGSEEGMVLDFGFLKDILMHEVDAPCDHGLILWVEDSDLLRAFLGPLSIQDVEAQVQDYGCCAVVSPVCGKLYVLAGVPTAEHLAQHWFGRMEGPVRVASKGRGTLTQVKVWETPNCYVVYPSGVARMYHGSGFALLTERSSSSAS